MKFLRPFSFHPQHNKRTPFAISVLVNCGSAAVKLSVSQRRGKSRKTSDCFLICVRVKSVRENCIKTAFFCCCCWTLTLWLLLLVHFLVDVRCRKSSSTSWPVDDLPLAYWRNHFEELLLLLAFDPSLCEVAAVAVWLLTRVPLKSLLLLLGCCFRAVFIAVFAVFALRP